MRLLPMRPMLAKLCLLFAINLGAGLSALHQSNAVGWADVSGLLVNMPSLSVITKNIQDATNNAIEIYNVATLAILRGKLRSLRHDVIDVNAGKLRNLQDMNDYVNQATYHRDWPTLQANWSAISIKILALSSEMSVGYDANVITMSAAISIKDILTRQADLYKALSTTPEPKIGTSEWKTFKETYNQLNDMYNQVNSLEIAIGQYLEKHPT
jgi:hypothetical protein